MAKKKKHSARKTSARAAKKRKKPASKKRTTPKRSTGSTSVDAILKRFARDRSVKEAQLDALKKKKEEVEKKAEKLRGQIVKLADLERKAQDELAQLDSRRDQEVSQLLVKLGVQLRERADPSGTIERVGHSLPNGIRPAGNRVAPVHSKGRESLN